MTIDEATERTPFEVVLTRKLSWDARPCAICGRREFVLVATFRGDDDHDCAGCEDCADGHEYGHPVCCDCVERGPGAVPATLHAEAGAMDSMADDPEILAEPADYRAVAAMLRRWATGEWVMPSVVELAAYRVVSDEHERAWAEGSP